MTATDRRRTKRAIRKCVIERILSLDPAVRSSAEATLAERFRLLPGFAAADSVLLYVTAFPEEIATGPMLAHALAAGKRVLCPRVDRQEQRLRLCRIEAPAFDLVPGTLGIPEPRPECPEVEPDAVDWVLVPGLAFDRRGYRVGRGAGHYDRLLPRLRADAPRWALIHDCQWIDRVPDEPHDVPLDGIVSPGTEIVRAAPRQNS